MNTTRPPPPAGNPPPYAFVGRVYKRSLRPIVIAAALSAAIWCGLWGISALSDLNDDSGYKAYDIALGTLLLVATTIEVFGIFAAWKQSLALVKTYAMLSIVSAVIVSAAELIRLIVYFKDKKKLIDDCATDADGATFTSWTHFWGGGWSSSSTTLTGDQARAWCNDRWESGVWGTIAVLLIALVLGWFYVSLSFSYYHQLLQPQSIAPSSAYRMGAYPHQAGAYDPSTGYHYPGAPAQGFRGYQEDYVPPYDSNKVPDYFPGGGAPPAEKEGDAPAPTTFAPPAGTPPGFAPPAGPPPNRNDAFGDGSRNV